MSQDFYFSEQDRIDLDRRLRSTSEREPARSLARRVTAEDARERTALTFGGAYVHAFTDETTLVGGGQ